jgi:peptide/nickel transport system substrate-binding protein
VELATRGQFNYGKYSNPQVDTLLAQMQGEIDPVKRQALSKQIQEVIKTDVPALYLVASPLAYAYKKGKVKNLTVHPNDVYLIDNKLAVQ